MTQYATHRFGVGQQVVRRGTNPDTCEVIALLAGRNGPEYRVASRDDRSQAAVVAETELTYAPASASTVPVSKV